MGVLGNIVKASFEVLDSLDITKTRPEESQKQELEELLKKAKDTAFGKYYGFENLLKEKNISKAFKEAVPIHDYKRIHQKWWKQQQSLPDITWPGKPKYFSLSSGTTGKSSKRIPVTEDFLSSIKRVGLSMTKTIAGFDINPDFFEKEVLMLTSSSNLLENKKGFKEGEISGINASEFPNWYNFFYRPGKDIASIDDWDSRLKAIVKEAPNWDIGTIAGIPSWVFIMLKAIIKEHGLKSIHDIWPNFTLYCTGGVAYNTYRSAFEKICEKRITVLDTYLASEGFFAYTARPDTLAMTFAFNHGTYYEFIPFDDNGFDKHGDLLDKPEVYSIEEVKQNKEYALVVSTSAGAWRYLIGDTLKFTDMERKEFVLTGRTKFFLNVVGSQLSEEKLDQAILHVSKQLDVEVNEYSVGAIKVDDDYYHQWVIVTDGTTDKKSWEENLDDYLKSANKNYKVARDKALKGVIVEVISKDTYHNYLERKKKKGGQTKTPKVMTERKMNEYLKFIRDKS